MMAWEEWAKVNRSIPEEYNIRNADARKLWMSQNEGCTILAFYNTGRNLFVEPDRRPATDFFNNDWIWVRYKTFKCRSKIRLTNSNKGHNKIRLRHRGHNPDKSVVVSVTPSFYTKLLTVTKVIRPMNIAFFAISEGRVTSVLIQYQPLPIKLFPVFQKELEKVK